jgi:hypothetical protein
VHSWDVRRWLCLRARYPQTFARGELSGCVRWIQKDSSPASSIPGTELDRTPAGEIRTDRIGWPIERGYSRSVLAQQQQFVSGCALHVHGERDVLGKLTRGPQLHGRVGDDSVKHIFLLMGFLLLSTGKSVAQTQVQSGPVDPPHCDPKKGQQFFNNSSAPGVMKFCDSQDHWSPVGGGANVAGKQNDVQCRNGSALAACGNIANGPGNAQYVTANGNDSNDGKSWSTAKATIYAAIEALPGGSSTTVGTGTVYVGGGNVPVGGPVANQGIWLMGANDPNFASPPPGWLKWPNSWTTLKIMGYDPMVGGANGRDTMAQVRGCGTQHTAPTPCLWLSAIAGGFSLENIQFPNYKHGSYVKIGITSTGDRGGPGGVSGVRIRNINGNYGDGQLGDGPCIDIGSNTFWLDLEDVNCGGSKAEMYSIVASTGLSRSGGVVTVTTTATNDLFVGQRFTVWNATDPTFNGNFVVTGVSGSPQTHAAWNQAGPNATSGSGYLWSDRAFAIAINPGSGTGSGAILITNLSTGSGGLRVNCGTSGGDAEADYVFEDAPFAPAPPPVEFVGNGGNGHCGGTFKHVAQADITINVPSLLNWPGSGQNIGADFIIGTGRLNTYGPAILLSQDAHTAYNATLSPTAQGQSGVYNGVLVGAEDAARRLFSPATVRFPNLAATNPASWSTAGGTLTKGLLAPDGTSNAASWFSAGGFGVGFYSSGGANITPNPGDWYIGGVWERGGGGISVGFGAGFPYTGDYCTNGSQQVTGSPYMVGDGQWFWETAACKVWAGPTTTEVFFSGIANPSTTVTYYAPVFLHISAGTLTDNEVAELVRNLSTYSKQAVTGDVAMLPSQRFGFSSGSSTNEFLGYLTQNNTANRTYTFPDSTGTVCLTGINCMSLPTQQQTEYDNFNRANNPIGAGAPVRWAVPLGSLNVSSDAVVGASKNVWNWGVVTSPAFPSDHFAEVTVANTSGPEGAIVRGSNGAASGYLCTEDSSGQYIRKVTSGAGSNLVGNANAAVVGDVIRCEAQGAALQMYINGVQVLNTSDNTYSTGNPGLSIYSNTAALDDWSAGPLVSFATLNREEDWSQPQHFSSLTVGAPSPSANHGTLPAGSLITTLEYTASECFSSASPAVCGSSIDGFVAIPAGASSVVVDTTAVTANSNIQLTFDTTKGSQLKVTCNTTPQQPYVSGNVPGANFTISVPANFTTNPGCIGYHIKN